MRQTRSCLKALARIRPLEVEKTLGKTGILLGMLGIFLCLNLRTPGNAATIITWGSTYPDQTNIDSGTVVVWGSNYLDQTNMPAGLTNVIAIAAGDRESLALNADGTVVGWGGRFGNGLITPPAGLANVIGIAIGASNSMALKADGSVVVWGTNGFGSVLVPAGLTNMVAIAGGFNTSFVLRQDGVLLAWGIIVGTTNLTAVRTNVVATAQGGLSSGGSHLLILTPEGRVLAWGDNSLGQCDVPADLTNVIAVSAGYGYSLAVKADGTVVSWGRVWDGTSLVPFTVPPEATNVVAVSTRGSIGMALRADGTVVAWGSYWEYPGPEVPITVPAGLTNVIAISAGAEHCVALIGKRPPVRHAAVTGFQYTGDTLNLTLPTRSGRVYRLEQSSSPFGTNWTPMAIAPGNGALQTLTDSTATNAVRLYRVRQW